jgi:hypothetical protein
MIFARNHIKSVQGKKCPPAHHSSSFARSHLETSGELSRDLAACTQDFTTIQFPEGLSRGNGHRDIVGDDHEVELNGKCQLPNADSPWSVM